MPEVIHEGAGAQMILHIEDVTKKKQLKVYGSEQF
jgi:hypothetical protein